MDGFELPSGAGETVASIHVEGVYGGASKEPQYVRTISVLYTDHTHNTSFRYTRREKYMQKQNK
jgi:hypothetical protein